MISGIIGLPPSTYSEVNSWAKAIMEAGFTEGGVEKAARAQQQMFALFSGLLEERSRAPEGNLFSGLATASLDGELLPLPVKAATAMTVLLAGHETTAALLSNVLHLFMEQPRLQQRLWAQPELIPAALWEVLRLRPSLMSMYRTATKDTNLEGQKAKSQMPGSAQPTATGQYFLSPTAFPSHGTIIDQILSFGYGLHHCVGDNLAKAQARIVFEVLLSRLQDIRPSGPAIAGASAITSGWQSLPVTFPQTGSYGQAFT